jgi:hypothetical protein
MMSCVFRNPSRVEIVENKRKAQKIMSFVCIGFVEKQHSTKLQTCLDTLNYKSCNWRATRDSNF